MPENQIALHCPKCGERTHHAASGELNPESQFTCSSCGASSTVAELKTASGQTLLEHAADMFRDVLKDVKGFTPRR